jgi:hypothetical protein
VIARPEFRQLFVDRNLAFSQPRDVDLAQVGRASFRPRFRGIFRHSRSAAGRDRDGGRFRAASPGRCVVSDRPQTVGSGHSDRADLNAPRRRQTDFNSSRIDEVERILTQPKQEQIEYYVSVPFGWAEGLGEFD